MRKRNAEPRFVRKEHGFHDVLIPDELEIEKLIET